MDLVHSFRYYLYNLEATSSNKARKIWKQMIKEKWNYECAYCGSDENLTLDHIIPQSNGGLDITTNTLCCCRNCNHDKGNKKWDKWFSEQSFFTLDRYEKIINWIQPKENNNLNLYPYKIRRNNCT